MLVPIEPGTILNTVGYVPLSLILESGKKCGRSRGKAGFCPRPLALPGCDYICRRVGFEFGPQQPARNSNNITVVAHKQALHYRSSR
eukprot:scaffold139350_cov51-Attheya_sp.AAC.2